MSDQAKLPPGGSSGDKIPPITIVGGLTLPAMGLSGAVTVSDIRDAIQELLASNLEELRRLLAEYYRDHKAGNTSDSDVLAVQVETTAKMGKVARLVRAAAKWGAVTIIASLIGAGVDHEVSDLIGWTPPPITIVRQMSPSQVDELSHQIYRQLEQMRQQ